MDKKYQALSDIEKIKLIQEIVHNLEARKAFAASLSVPVRQAVAEQSSVRMIFAEDPLPAGALAQYPVEPGPEGEAWVLPRLGSIPTNFVQGDEVFVPTFEVAHSYSIKMAYARDGRFNVVDRIKTKLKDGITKKEEEAGWSVIKASVPTENIISVAGTEGTYFSKKLINEMIAHMEGYGYEPDLLACSVKSAAEIREWDNTKLDEATRREVFQNRGLKAIWGIAILPLRRLGDDEVYLFDTSRYGVMPVRQTLVVLDDPTLVSQLKIGFIAYEEIGFGALDTKAVVKGNIVRS